MKMPSKSMFVWFLKHKQNNRGVSLVELLVAISILTIIAAPFMGMIVSSTRNNISTDEEIETNAIAQKYMEELKAKPTVLTANDDATLRTYATDGDYTVKYKVDAAEQESVTESATYTSTEPTTYEITITDLAAVNGSTLTITTGPNAYDFGAGSTAFVLDGTSVDILIDAADTNTDFTLTIDTKDVAYGTPVNVYIADDTNDKIDITHSLPTSYSMEFDVKQSDLTKMIFRGVEYIITTGYKLVLADVTIGQAFDYEWRNASDTVLKEGYITWNATMTSDLNTYNTISNSAVNIHIDYNQSGQTLNLDVDRDSLDASSDVYFYVSDDASENVNITNLGARSVKTTSTKLNYYHITLDDELAYSNYLYKIEVQVLNSDGDILSQLNSYVKKEQ